MTASREQTGFVLLMLAGLVIAGLCYYKTTREYQPVLVKQVQSTQKRPAPHFELYDQHKPSKTVRLVSYLGRHRIVLVFFDGNVGPFDDPLLTPFREHAAELKAARTIVIGISDALPQTIRKQMESHHQKQPDVTGRDNYDFPFALLSDPDFRVQRLYARYDEQQQQPKQGIFVIDRAGQLEWSQSGPIPFATNREAILQLITGEK